MKKGRPVLTSGSILFQFTREVEETLFTSVTTGHIRGVVCLQAAPGVTANDIVDEYDLMQRHGLYNPESYALSTVRTEEEHFVVLLSCQGFENLIAIHKGDKLKAAEELIQCREHEKRSNP